MCVEPERRIKIAQIWTHPFITQVPPPPPCCRSPAQVSLSYDLDDPLDDPLDPLDDSSATSDDVVSKSGSSVSLLWEVLSHHGVPFDALAALAAEEGGGYLTLPVVCANTTVPEEPPPPPQNHVLVLPPRRAHDSPKATSPSPSVSTPKAVGSPSARSRGVSLDAKRPLAVAAAKGGGSTPPTKTSPVGSPGGRVGRTGSVEGKEMGGLSVESLEKGIAKVNLESRLSGLNLCALTTKAPRVVIRDMQRLFADYKVF
jgi:hypothetical protein